MLVEVDHIAKWEEVLEHVEKDYIPIDCVKKIIVKLNAGRQKTINLESLRRHGLDIDEIEVVVSRTFIELGRQIASTEFIIDVKAVAKRIQPMTDQLLGVL